MHWFFFANRMRPILIAAQRSDFFKRSKRLEIDDRISAVTNKPGVFNKLRSLVAETVFGACSRPTGVFPLGFCR